MGAEYLLIGLWMVVAVGAALFVGTGAAILQQRRSGTPPTTGTHPAVPLDRRRALLRCAGGLALTVVGLVGVLLIEV